MWRPLSFEEIKSFKQWARDNYKPMDDISGGWHPVTQFECVVMNIEFMIEFNKIPVKDMKEVIMKLFKGEKI